MNALIDTGFLYASVDKGDINFALTKSGLIFVLAAV